MNKKGAGRPKNSYKYISLITNEPVNAIKYHRETKNLLKNKNHDTKMVKLNIQESKTEDKIKLLMKFREFVNQALIKELNKV